MAPNDLQTPSGKIALGSDLDFFSSVLLGEQEEHFFSSVLLLEQEHFFSSVLLLSPFSISVSSVAS